MENIFSPGSPVLLVQASATIRGFVLHVTGGDAIQLATSGIQVDLEDLTISGSSSNAVHFTASNIGLTMQRINIVATGGNGIYSPVTGSSLTGNHITVADAFTGVYFTAANGTVTVDNLNVMNASGTAVHVVGGAVSIRNSNLRGAGNTTSSIGFYVAGSGGVAGSGMIERSEIGSNGVGIEADGSGGGGTIRVSNSVIENNSTGLNQINAGQVISFRTNMFSGNGTDGTPELSTSLK